MSDMRVANLMSEAAGGMMEAVDGLTQLLQIYSEIEGMKAENELKKMQGEYPSYAGDDFARIQQHLIEVRASL